MEAIGCSRVGIRLLARRIYQTSTNKTNVPWPPKNIVPAIVQTYSSLCNSNKSNIVDSHVILRFFHVCFYLCLAPAWSSNPAIVFFKKIKNKVVGGGGNARHAAHVITAKYIISCGKTFLRKFGLIKTQRRTYKSIFSL